MCCYVWTTIVTSLIIQSYTVDVFTEARNNASHTQTYWWIITTSTNRTSLHILPGSTSYITACAAPTKWDERRWRDHEITKVEMWSVVLSSSAIQINDDKGQIVTQLHFHVFERMLLRRAHFGINLWHVWQCTQVYSSWSGCEWTTFHWLHCCRSHYGAQTDLQWDERWFYKVRGDQRHHRLCPQESTES